MSLEFNCSFITRWFLHSHTVSISPKCPLYGKTWTLSKNSSIVVLRCLLACSNLTKMFAHDPELCDGMEMCSKNTFHNLKAASLQKHPPWDVQKLPDEPSACTYKCSCFVEMLSLFGSVSSSEPYDLDGFPLVDLFPELSHTFVHVGLWIPSP